MLWKAFTGITFLLLFKASQQQSISKFKVIHVNYSNADLTWSKYTGASTYTLEYYPHPQDNHPKFIDDIPGNIQKYTLENLDSGTEYGVSLKAKAANKVLGRSTVAIFTTLGTKPVLDFQILLIKARSVSISWRANPAQIYDRFEVLVNNITGKVEDLWKKVDVNVNTAEATITGLKPATGYRVYVIGYLKNITSTKTGKGFGSAIEIPAPTNLRPTDETPTSVVVNWMTPNIEKFITFNHYVIEYAKLSGNGSDSKTTSNDVTKISQKIDQLAGETIYKFRIRAIVTLHKEKVEGLWSDWETFSTKQEAKLNAPTEVKVISHGNDFITITWEAPTGVVKEYVIKYYEHQTRPDKNPEIKTTVTTESITKLRSGTTYEIYVTAVSPSGRRGTVSSAKLLSTTGPKPVHADLTISEIKTTSAKISWTFVTGSTHDKLEVDVMEVRADKTLSLKRAYVGGLIKKSDTSLIVKDLESAHGYRIDVYTYNGTEKSSRVSNGFGTAISADDKKPFKCSHDLGKTLDEVILTCNKLIGKTVRNYETRINVHNKPGIRDFAEIQKHGATLDEKQKITITGLFSGYTYEIYVRVVFANGEPGSWSTAHVTPIPHGRPPLFANIVDISSDSAKIIWTDPYKLDSNNVKFEYIITYKSLQDLTVTQKTVINKQNEPKSAVITDLKSFHIYQVYISTQLDKEKDNGTAYVKAFTTGFAKPGPPLFPKLKQENGKIILTWLLIEDRTDIQTYNVLLESTDGKKVFRYNTKTGRQNTFTVPIEDVLNKVRYFARIRAQVNSKNLENSIGEWSTKQYFVLGENGDKIIETPTRFIPTIKTNEYALFQWKKPEGDDVYQYEVMYTRGDNGQAKTMLLSSLTTQVKLDRLEQDVTYMVQIRAVAINGQKSLWTAKIPVTLRAGTKPTTTTSSGLSGSVIAGIIVAVLIILLVVVIAVIIVRRRRKAQFNRFGNAVQFSRNDGGPHVNDGHHSEMDDPAATAIKKGNKLYT